MPETLTAPAFFPHLGDPIVLAELLSRSGVIEEGHFRLLSGAHSRHFLRFSEVARDPKALAHVAAAIAPTVAAWRPAGVLSPSTAGVSLGSELASRLGVPMHLADVDAAGRACALLGRASLERRAIVIVNDVVTTGEGLAALADVARAAGADIVGAAWFASRSSADVAAQLGVPVVHPVTLDLASFPVDDCPCCAEGEPATDALDLN